MKAGGLSIASVYVIWIHHEEEEGKFDFTGNRNLRGFLEAAKKVGISVFLRVGPWYTERQDTEDSQIGFK